MYEKIRKKKLELIYSHLSVSVLTACFSVIFISYVLWGHVDLVYYTVWLIAFNLIVIYRFSILLLYKKNGLEKLSLNLWDQLNFIGTLLTGFIWGVLTLFYSTEWPTEVSICLWVSLVALMAGASATFSVITRYFIAYCAPIFLLSVYSQFMADSYYIIVVYVFFTLLLTMTSINFKSAQTSIISHEIALEESNLQLQSLASEDALTKLPNRRAYDNYYIEEWGRNARSKNHLSLMMIDVDYFKNYNDHYGHNKGDKCLQDVAQIIQQSLHRASDMPARYGGEEFVVVLPETSREGAVAIAKRLHERLRALEIPHEYSNVSKLLTVSIGIAELIPKHGGDPKVLQLLADKELYKAKANGRNCISANQEDD